MYSTYIKVPTRHRVQRVVLRTSFVILSMIRKDIHVNVYPTYSKVLTRHRVQRVDFTYSKVPTRHRVQRVVLRTSFVILSKIRRTKSCPSDLFCYSLNDS